MVCRVPVHTVCITVYYCVLLCTTVCCSPRRESSSRMFPGVPVAAPDGRILVLNKSRGRRHSTVTSRDVNMRKAVPSRGGGALRRTLPVRLVTLRYAGCYNHATSSITSRTSSRNHPAETANQEPVMSSNRARHKNLESETWWFTSEAQDQIQAGRCSSPREVLPWWL